MDISPIQALLPHSAGQRCRVGSPRTQGLRAAHQGFLLLPQPLVIFHHLLLLLVQDLPHLEPFGLPQLLGLLSAAGSDEVLLLRGPRGERRGHDESRAQILVGTPLKRLGSHGPRPPWAAWFLARFVPKFAALYTDGYGVPQP